MNATKTIPAEFGFNKKNLVTAIGFKIFPSFYLLINLIINPNKKTPPDGRVMFILFHLLIPLKVIFHAWA